MRINRIDTIAVVIDVQQRLYPYIHDNHKLTDKLVRLVKGLRVLGIEIIVTEQYSKGLGNTIPEVQEALGEYNHLEKTSYSCCGLNDFNTILKNSGKNNVIIAGIESHVCVLQTVTDLCAKGYLPFVIEDCVSSRNPNDKKIAIERMRKEGAIISTYESILFELMDISGTDEFKAISKIVK
ncbi:MAG TPA: isochorismatase family protein [Ignavibacteria bacterium]